VPFSIGFRSTVRIGIDPGKNGISQKDDYDYDNDNDNEKDKDKGEKGGLSA
jgi:hypothetical protein